MAVLEIPFERTEVPFKERVVLDGVPYVLSFRYNKRMEIYTMDISDSAEVLLIAGLVLWSGFPLTFRYIRRITDFPLGNFMVVDETGLQRDLVPGIGKEVKLLYIEAE